MVRISPHAYVEGMFKSFPSPIGCAAGGMGIHVSPAPSSKAGASFFSRNGL